ncbi:MAG: glycoside hydrolase family 3 C-terminal domain-containing protein [Parabacteroides sp.]|nr:glycoside hydrolase family 3 C-terminal domain-containing protein [bacterium]MDY3141688.1 glycoside hydrolase family 3 C-terminal domain-containing protein [Parabacteroides sp.]MDY4103205.1 glycoside hydrolase family 3 C-terminal domain-containing protein [Parabacteroides sp.]MDY4552822.1 glycoside hydrolase family 3 C-terminal domain-containing protein [Parabacteroides sp.]
MNRKLKNTLLLAICSLGSLTAQTADFPFRDPSLPLEVRVKDIISRLTLEEKVELMKHEAPAVPRLGIPAYNWWNEALHGVARTKEKVTVFPQAIGMAATFDTEALQQMGDMTSSEGRALFNEDLKRGKTGEIYRGLTYWTPNINIFRDPRWGRGQETYGEDPYLTAKMGSAIVRGLEGTDPYYLKAVACAKHYAVHSGPEGNRHSYDARVSAYDLWDTYLPAFRELITKAKVHGVMCAYNRYEGTPCCGHNELLQDILRNQWKFDGYVTSDCWAVSDFAKYHKTHSNDTEAVADAVLSGTDLECGNLYQKLLQGVERGLISEREIDVSLARLFTIQFKLGMYDPADRVPYANIGREVIECDAHKAHAYAMAQKSMVLLKNDKQILPLNPKKIKRIALIGPNMHNGSAQLANYFGTPSEIITPYMSLQRRYGNQIQIDTISGTDIVQKIANGPSFAQIAAQARKADVIIFVSGLTADYEGEAGDAGAGGFSGFASGDRTTIQLPAVQTDLLKELKKTGRPIVLVNMSGSVMSFDWESRNMHAILQAWYGGQAAGDAIVDVLFGDYNPAGRMPLTTYMNDQDLPDFEDYSMANRTYRYFKGDVRYPFGYGLSYTTFAYQPLTLAPTVETGKSLQVSTTVTNTGSRDGDEVVQLYVKHPQNGNTRVPLKSLKGFKRIHLKKGESQQVTFTLSPEELALVDDRGNWIEKAGTVELFIGGGQPYVSEGSFGELQITGDAYQVE